MNSSEVQWAEDGSWYMCFIALLVHLLLLTAFQKPLDHTLHKKYIKQSCLIEFYVHVWSQHQRLQQWSRQSYKSGAYKSTHLLFNMAHIFCAPVVTIVEHIQIQPLHVSICPKFSVHT